MFDLQPAEREAKEEGRSEEGGHARETLARFEEPLSDRERARCDAGPEVRDASICHPVAADSRDVVGCPGIRAKIIGRLGERQCDIEVTRPKKKIGEAPGIDEGHVAGHQEQRPILARGDRAADVIASIGALRDEDVRGRLAGVAYGAPADHRDFLRSAGARGGDRPSEERAIADDGQGFHGNPEGACEGVAGWAAGCDCRNHARCHDFLIRRKRGSAAVSDDELGWHIGKLEDSVDVLEITYQPILDLATGKIVKCEALCRPREAGADLAAYVEAAERDGSIRSFNARVIDGVIADWHKNGPPNVDVSINLSVTNLIEADLVKRIEKALKKNRFEGKNLWFEVDDRARAVDDPSSLKALLELGKIGVRFSLDSFGDDFTQATLYELQRLAIGELKVDGRYVLDADLNMRHRGVITATVALAKHLGIGVCAKGIESESVAALMLRLGCTLGQGFYFARPVSAAVVSELVDKMAHGRPMRTGR